MKDNKIDPKINSLVKKYKLYLIFPVKIKPNGVNKITDKNEKTKISII